MPFPRGIAVDQPGLELFANPLGALHAHADEPTAAVRQPLDRGYPDVLGKAACHDRAFVHAKIDGPAHWGLPRFAAAIASAGLE